MDGQRTERFDKHYARLRRRRKPLFLSRSKQTVYITEAYRLIVRETVFLVRFIRNTSAHSCGQNADLI
jgi:hypothetical protein